MIPAYLHNFRGIVLVAIIMAISMLYYIHLNGKQKKNYESVTGQITYFDKKYMDLPNRNLEKYRYLKVSGYPYPFELFIGKDAGDFKPKFEQLDKLKIRDKVTVYYYQTTSTLESHVNRFAQFIDKNNQSVFERSDSNKTLGIVIIGLCGLLVILGIELYKRRKISY